MVSGSVPKGRIGIAASPSQDGSTVNDEITGSNEPSSEGLQNGQHEERLMHRSESLMTAFALLGFTRDTDVSIFAQWQATRKGQSGPTL
jgi:hypothetical protein